ncbi:NAD(P)H oxidoreductase [Prolixibacteraceae bacterium JC049]|nr:NAD(P)H oxidoreductase [Prolixibacteraceae bacterium JC049]
MKILINYAHPNNSRSLLNKALCASLQGLENVTLNDLYANYPDFIIDVKREQQLCEEHDVIVFQHPFYWYSTPAIIKEWFDLVLEYGWAYGSSGKALEGKSYFHCITAASEDSTYQKNGSNIFTIKELTTPMQATANLCKMNWFPPFMVLGVHRDIPVERVQQYAEDYRRVIIAFRDEKINLQLCKNRKYLNDDLDQLIKRI